MPLPFNKLRRSKDKSPLRSAPPAATQQSHEPTVPVQRHSRPPTGLVTVYDPVEADLDIVAVHGLNGHSEETWTAANNVNWLRDLLPKDLRKARICTWGYDANTHSTSDVSVSYLFQHSGQLLGDLNNFREITDTTQRPIIFVAYSLGGIVLKQALIQSTGARLNANLSQRSISISTYGIIFLGTPHQGSGTANIGTFFANVVSLFLPANHVNQGLLEKLKENSEFLLQQINAYNPVGLNYVTKFGYEEYATPIGLGKSILNLFDWLIRGPNDDSKRIWNYGAPESNRSVLSGRQRGNGSWLLENPHYKQWLRGVNSVLWCHGSPGAGKTVTATYLVDTLEQSSDGFVLRVFCHYFDRPKAPKSVALLLTGLLLKQCLTKRGGIPRGLTKMYDASRTTGAGPQFDQVSNVLIELLEKMRVNTYIVIDALDEWPTNSNQEADLIELLKRLSGCSRMVITSRKTFNLPQWFTTPNVMDIEVNVMDIEIKAQEVELRNYVDIRLGRERCLNAVIKQDPSLRTIIESSVVQKSGDSFLLAVLRMDYYASKSRHSIGALRKALEETPRTVEDFYAEGLVRIREQDDDHSEYAESILTWVHCAYRPLKVREVLFAIEIKTEISELTTANLAQAQEEYLISICAGLIRINPNQQTVHLLHYTLADYMNSSRGNFNWPSMQTKLAASCMTYLLYDAFGAGMSTSEEELELKLHEHGFLGYAAVHWGNHVQEVPGQTLNNLVFRLLNSQRHLECATQAYFTVTKRGTIVDGENYVSALNVAAGFGLVEIVDLILLGKILHSTDISDAQSTQQLIAHYRLNDGWLGNPLHWAFLGDPDSCIAALLKHDKIREAINERDSGFMTPIMIAFVMRLPTVIKLLLQHGADVSLGWANTKLTFAHWAVVSKDSHGTSYLQGLEILLSGAQVAQKEILLHGVNIHGESALHSAAFLNETECAKILLRHGASLYARTAGNARTPGITPFYCAMFAGRLQMLELLSTFDKKETTVAEQVSLLAVPNRNVIEVLDFILMSGWKVESQDDKGDTLLHVCVRAKHIKAVERLLTEQNIGVALSAVNHSGDTAVREAVASGQKYILELLLNANTATFRRGANFEVLFFPAVEGRAIDRVIQLLHHAGREQWTKLLSLKNHLDRSPLSLAFSHEDQDLARVLLRTETEIAADDPIHRYTRGESALRETITGGLPSYIDLLTEHGFFDIVDHVCKENSSDLTFLAVRDGSAETCLRVLKLDHDYTMIRARDGRGRTALHYACSMGSCDKAKMLIAHGLHRTDQDSKGHTGLHKAAKHNLGHVVLCLLNEDKSCLPIRDNNGRTALHLAIECNASYAAFALFCKGDSIIEALSIEHKAWIQTQSWYTNQSTKGSPTINRAPTEYVDRSSRTYRRKQTLEITEGSRILLESDALPNTTRPHPVKKIHFKITSKLHGYSHTMEYSVPFKQNYTWFEVALHRNGTRLSGPRLVENTQTHSVFREHSITWTDDADRNGVSESQTVARFHKDIKTGRKYDEEVAAWVRCLEPGDRVVVMAAAERPGWVNFIQRAEMVLYTGIDD